MRMQTRLLIAGFAMFLCGLYLCRVGWWVTGLFFVCTAVSLAIEPQGPAAPEQTHDELYGQEDASTEVRGPLGEGEEAGNPTPLAKSLIGLLLLGTVNAPPRREKIRLPRTGVSQSTQAQGAD